MSTIHPLNPIMPKKNYEDLNNLFGNYFAKALDSIGSFYFTKEAFDGTYPGYGSSYPDIQGGLGLLFEQASSRGHKQKTAFGEITFPFTIRNQYTSSITTVKAAVENKDYLRSYQKEFFKTAMMNSGRSVSVAADSRSGARCPGTRFPMTFRLRTKVLTRTPTNFLSRHRLVGMCGSIRGAASPRSRSQPGLSRPARRRTTALLWSRLSARRREATMFESTILDTRTVAQQFPSH